MVLYKSSACMMGLGVERSRAALYRQIRNEVTRLPTAITSARSPRRVNALAHRTLIATPLMKAKVALLDHVQTALSEVT